jgi:SPX domain protein involved in polyphosphate accumulation
MTFAKKDEMDFLNDLDLELESQFGFQNNKFPVRERAKGLNEKTLRVDSSASSLVFLRHVLLNQKPSSNGCALKTKIIPFKKKE